MKASIYILFLLLILTSCNSNVVFEASKNFPDNTWSASRVATFNIAGMDTLNTYDINIVLRNTNDYEFSSIYLIAELHKPNKTVEVDTLEYLMANPDGSWLGTGNAVKESWLAYKHNFTFDTKGAYTITISQANRKNGTVNGVKNLKGITDVGIQITKNE